MALTRAILIPYNARSGYLLMRMALHSFFHTSRPFPRAAELLARYGLAVLSCGITLIVYLFLHEVFIENVPLTLFIIPIAVSAWFGGSGPGLLATALSGIMSDYFLSGSRFSFEITDPVDWERWILFLAASGLVNVLIMLMRDARRELEARAREAEQRQNELEEQLIERERARAERERLIEELETERARFNAIIEHMPAGVLLAEAPDGRIIMSNPQVERILGHAAPSSSDVESYQDWMNYDVNGRRVRGRESVLASTIQGQIVTGQEILYHRGDGRDAWVSISGAPISDAGGSILGGVILITDIDKEKRASERLRINQERLNLAQKATRAIGFEWNIQTDEVIWPEGAEVLFGLGPGRLGGTYADWRNCLHPEDASRAEQDLRRVIADGEGSFEFRVIWPDGSVRWIQARAKVFFDEAGKPSRMIGIDIDVTERKQMEESLRRQTMALQEADRRKDEFLATLAHELRNPLAPISNSIRILELRGNDPQAVARTREVMERQVRQMTHLVNDLLEVSRIGQGKIRLERAPVDLADVIATAVEACRPLVEAHHHTLTISLPERPVRVEADSARLAQVLSNLLNNAAKYTEDGGRIDLTVEQSRGDAVIRVRDNGIGIAPERLPTIFDMFEQIEGAADRSHGGLGIGLTLARRLVEMQGGKIEAHSAGLGKGSEFVTRLPALAEPQTEPAPEPKEGLPTPPGGRRRVMIVDDNVDSAESMAALLRLYGHEVRLAHDGEAAIEGALSFRPEVIFLDLNLPKMDGYEVARRLRQDPAMCDMTLVAMTGYCQEEERRRTREAGFHSHLVKPVDFDRLRELLESLPAKPSLNEQSRDERRRAKAN
jgi:PAS domain S-box-containing protein